MAQNQPPNMLYGTMLKQHMRWVVVWKSTNRICCLRMAPYSIFCGCFFQIPITKIASHRKTKRPEKTECTHYLSTETKDVFDQFWFCDVVASFFVYIFLKRDVYHTLYFVRDKSTISNPYKPVTQLHDME